MVPITLLRSRFRGSLKSVQRTEADPRLTWSIGLFMTHKSGLPGESRTGGVEDIGVGVLRPVVVSSGTEVALGWLALK
jgi:hypothetical protein